MDTDYYLQTILLAINIISNNSKLSSNVEVVDNLYIEKLTIKE